MGVGSSVLEREKNKTELQRQEEERRRQEMRRACSRELYGDRASLAFSDRARLGKTADYQEDEASYQGYRVNRIQVPAQNYQAPAQEEFAAPQAYAAQEAQPVQNFAQPVYYSAAAVADPEPRVYAVPEAPADNYAQAAPQWDYAPAANTGYEYEAEDENLLPTSTTSQYRTTGAVVSNAAVQEQEFTLSAASKVVLAVFITIVLAAFAIIMVNTMVINTIQSEVEALTEQATVLQGEFDSLRAQIEIATSEQTVIDYAESIGMVRG